MRKITLDEGMTEAIPEILYYAKSGDTTMHQTLEKLCLMASAHLELRVALWTFMIIFAAEFDGVSKQLKRQSEQVRGALGATLESPMSQTVQ